MRGPRQAAIVGVVTAIGAHLGADALDSALVRLPLSNDALAAIAIIATAYLAVATIGSRRPTAGAVTAATIGAIAGIEAVAHLVAGHSLHTALAIGVASALIGGAVVAAVAVVDRCARRAASLGSPSFVVASPLGRIAVGLDAFIVAPVEGSATLRGPPASSR